MGEAVGNAIEGYKLSPQQRRAWELSREGLGLYAQCAVTLRGTLDGARLVRALDAAAGRHEALRTYFSRLAGMEWPLQVVAEAKEFSPPTLDLRGSAELEAELRAALGRERDAACDASDGWRALLALTGEDEAVLVLTASALCCDAGSLLNLLAEVRAEYGGETVEEAVQYVDYSEWQNELLAGEEAAAGLAYWEGQQGGRSDVRLGFEAGRHEAAGRGAQKFVEVECAPRLGEELSAVAAAHGVGEEVLLLATWQLLLSRHAGSQEVVTSALFDGRRIKHLRDACGLFARYLPVPVRLAADYTFSELVSDLGGRMREAHVRQEFYVSAPETSSEESERPRTTFGFEMERWPETARAAGINFIPLELTFNYEPFTLRLSASLREGSLFYRLHHDAAQVDAAWARLLLGQYETLLRSCLADPSAPLSRHEALSEAEREDILTQSARNSRPYPASPLLPELIAAAAVLDPEAEAILDGARSVTRGQLWRAAGRVAGMLRSSGVRRGDRVGLLAGRNAEAIAGLLGCWRLGAAYVPLDGSQPAARLESMLDDCGARAVLVSGESSSVSGGGRELLDLSAADLFSDAGEVEGEVGELEDEAGDIAYLIYTSGTTGSPKGVAVTHGSLLNLLHALDESVYSQSPVSRVSVNAPLWFDASVKQLVQLGLGRSLNIVPEDVRMDAEALAQWVVSSGVGAFDCTPSHLRALLGAGLRHKCEESGAALRHLLIGGEAIDEALWAELAQWGDVSSHNLYGPTECTVDVTHHVISEGGAPSLGLPLANVEAYVLDEHDRLCPSGVAGELCAGGAGVAVGYWGDARRTAEKFIPDAYSGRPGARLYRTGDVARRGADGALTYEGRADGQVKVRGFRIELGEVEAGLRGVSWVSEAAAAVVGEGDAARLVGYVVPHAKCEGVDCEHDVVIAREYVGGLLPEYMVPAQIVMLDSLPLTTNGKLDRKALPAPEEVATPGRGERTAPRTPHEEMLCGLFAGVLSVGAVGAEDNFFSLGGHSLLATQLVSRVREGFGVSLPLRSLFERPTPRQLAVEVEALSRAGSVGGPPPLVRAERGEGGELPLSFAQQRLWFLDQLEPGSANYNCPAAVRLSGRLDLRGLRWTLFEVIRRHEALRARFVEREGSPVQLIGEAVDVRLPVIDLSGLGEVQREAEARRVAGEQAREGFDLQRGPLLRAAAVRLGEQEHVGLLTTHHIASDAWSVGVLVREVGALYAAYTRGEESPLAEPEVQYGDYAAWQRGWLQGEALEEHLKYWRGKLSGAPATLELPTDRPRPAAPSHQGARHSFVLPEELSDSLRGLCRQTGTTLFMLMLAAYQTLLQRYTEQDDILIGADIANRNRRETEGLIGFFINMLVLRADLSDDPSFLKLLERARETALDAYAHQDLPFDKLVEELQPERKGLNHSPFFRVVLLFQNTPEEELALPELTISRLDYEADVVRFDLTLMVDESAGELRGFWGYSTDLFDPETVERMHGHFVTLLRSIVQSPEARLRDLEMFTEEERRQRDERKRQRDANNKGKLKSIKRKSVNVAPVVAEKTEAAPGL